MVVMSQLEHSLIGLNELRSRNGYDYGFCNRSQIRIDKLSPDFLRLQFSRL
jgi:hypothetical protein